MNKSWLALLSYCVMWQTSCSKKNLDSIDSFFEGRQEGVIKSVEMDQNFVVLLHKDQSSGEDQLLVTRNNKVVVSVKAFGNGNTITVTELSNRPGIIVHQTQSLNVIRYLYTDDGGVKEIVYDDNGQIDVENVTTNNRERTH